MYKLKNEDGYALLSVLLIITVFMIVSLSFMSQAFSSVKQNQVVEKSSQSVALAEMGITHYQVAVQNIYEANIGPISTQVKNQIAVDRNLGLINNTSTSKKSEDYVNLGISLMKTAIKNGLTNEQQSISIDGKSNASFSLVEKDFFLSTNDKKIFLKVKGDENGKTTFLSTVMTFAPTVSNLTSATGSSGSYVLPSFNSIQPPKTTDPGYCKNPAGIGACQSIMIDENGTGNFSENNQIAGKYIFSSGLLDFSGNAQKTINTKIHSGSTINFGKNMINAQNVEMESNGAATFGGNLTIDDSKFNINGKLKVDGKFDMTNKSIVYVNGDVVITSHLNMTSGTTLCVAGTLTYKKNGSKTGGNIVIKNKSLNPDPVFNQKCGKPATPVTDVQWGDTVLNDVNYEY
jgi:hypothetical protein